MFLIDIMLIVIIDMHKGSLDIRQSFQLALQCLAHIMRLSKLSLRIHDDINLDIKLLSRVIRATLYVQSVNIQISLVEFSQLTVSTFWIL